MMPERDIDAEDRGRPSSGNPDGSRIETEREVVENDMCIAGRHCDSASPGDSRAVRVDRHGDDRRFEQ